MRVAELGYECKGDELRTLIVERCGNVRRFSHKVGLTESMMSHILHGRRKIYSWNVNTFAKALKIEPEQIKEYIAKVQ